MKDPSNKENDGKHKFKYLPKFDIKHIIIDFSCINFIDSQGINGIIQVTKNIYFK